ncbi:MAG: hypothetical protein ACR9NN_22510 [Nostochopsis sp.]
MTVASFVPFSVLLICDVKAIANKAKNNCSGRSHRINAIVHYASS